MTIVERLAVARGDQPADLILRNARLINVISGEIYTTDIVVHGEYIVALGEGYSATKEIDIAGRYVAPGFIDAHVHIESSLCTAPEYARAVLPHGVTAVVTDPHEIANVMGLDGIDFMLKRSENVPLSVFVMASSCVPATDMETSGAKLEAGDLATLIDNPRVLGLAEVMNYPAVIQGDEGMLDKLSEFHSTVIDGHCPALTGKELNAYVTAGIQSEHECTTPEEALEKLRLGMTIYVREGTTTRNLLPLLPIVKDANHQQLCFCTDDRMPASLIDEGTIDFMVRIAIQNGVDPIHAIRMGTINTARHFRLHQHGAVVPNRFADMVVFSDLDDLQVEMTFRHGTLVAKDGAMLGERSSVSKIALPQTVNVDLDALDLSIPAESDLVRVIGAVGDQVVTENRIHTAKLENQQAVTNIEHDILKMVVVERHHASGNIGKGFIHGFGIKRGAIAGTVAHDHHNLVCIGADDASMRTAINGVATLQGGIVVADGNEILASLALPVAGLMSEAAIEEVRADYDALIAAAQELGSTMPDPIMAMSFMGLEVIPSLKLTDVGLVDVEKFAVVNLFV